jgi:hypothetical protein
MSRHDREKSPQQRKRGAGNRVFKDPEVKQRFFYALKLGGTIEDACHYAKIRKIHVERERIADKEFRRKLDRMMIGVKLHHIENVYNAENRWQASAWWLERRHREEYAVNLPEGVDDEVRAIKVRHIVRTKSPGIREPGVQLQKGRRVPRKPTTSSPESN